MIDTRSLINNHERRLQKLKERQATQGIDSNVSIGTEIEDIEKNLIELYSQRLQEIKKRTSTKERAIPTELLTERKNIETRLKQLGRPRRHPSASHGSSQNKVRSFKSIIILSVSVVGCCVFGLIGVVSLQFFGFFERSETVAIRVADSNGTSVPGANAILFLKVVP